VTDALIRWIGGPVLKAKVEGEFHVQESLAVGERGLLGEVIQLKDDELVAQVYEDTTGLKPGDKVSGSGQPLTVTLGPGLLGHIFDGLLRPLADASVHFFKPGGSVPLVGRVNFVPTVGVGDAVEPGQEFGDVIKDGPRLACIVPPNCKGRVESIVAAGDYDDRETLCTLTDKGGRTHDLSATQTWPVRTPRPVRRRLGPEAPMVTAQRILDTLFPVARGGRAALPGGFGTGKTILQESLAKWCDADVIVYVGWRARQ